MTLFFFPHEEIDGHKIDWGKCVLLEVIYINAIILIELAGSSRDFECEKGDEFDRI